MHSNSVAEHSIDSKTTASLSPKKHTRPRVAFQGERGAYSEDAVDAFWRQGALVVPSWTFEDVVLAVVRGTADSGVLPVHNSIAGPIMATQNLIAQTPSLDIIDTISVPIKHALLAPFPVSLSELRLVTSHSVALAQCQQFLRRYPLIVQLGAYDTAGAARDIAARRIPQEAGIASTRAADRYKLHVLAEEIQDIVDNETRFAVIEQRRGDRW